MLDRQLLQAPCGVATDPGDHLILGNGLWLDVGGLLGIKNLVNSAGHEICGEWLFLFFCLTDGLLKGIKLFCRIFKPEQGPHMGFTQWDVHFCGHERGDLQALEQTMGIALSHLDLGAAKTLKRGELGAVQAAVPDVTEGLTERDPGLRDLFKERAVAL